MLSSKWFLEVPSRTSQPTGNRSTLLTSTHRIASLPLTSPPPTGASWDYTTNWAMCTGSLVIAAASGGPRLAQCPNSSPSLGTQPQAEEGLMSGFLEAGAGHGLCNFRMPVWTPESLSQGKWD